MPDRARSHPDLPINCISRGVHARKQPRTSRSQTGKYPDRWEIRGNKSNKNHWFWLCNKLSGRSQIVALLWHSLLYGPRSRKVEKVLGAGRRRLGSWRYTVSPGHRRRTILGRKRNRALSPYWGSQVFLTCKDAALFEEYTGTFCQDILAIILPPNLLPRTPKRPMAP